MITSSTGVSSETVASTAETTTYSCSACSNCDEEIFRPLRKVLPVNFGGRRPPGRRSLLMEVAATSWLLMSSLSAAQVLEHAPRRMLRWRLENSVSSRACFVDR